MTHPYTPAQLEAWAGLGPWRTCNVSPDLGHIYGSIGRLATSIGGESNRTQTNAALIAAAPTLARLVLEKEKEIARLKAKLNTPEVDDFAQAVVSEAQHQRDRWGSEHDAGKKPLDWFWLIGYLAQKAAEAAMKGDAFKAKHHTISTAAALANWHAALNGDSNSMRPGIEPPSHEGNQ